MLTDRKTDAGEHWELDLDDPAAGWQSVAPLPYPRNHFGTVVLGGEIYVVGGQWGHDSVTQDLDFVHAYDPVTDSWRTSAPLPFPRSHFEPSIFTVAGQIAVLGGRNMVWGQGTLPDITTYSPATNSWTQRTPLPLSLIAPAAQKVGRWIVVTGGGTGPTQPITQTYLHDLEAHFDRGPTRFNAGGDYHHWGAPGGAPGGAGSRIFDVWIEGQNVLSAYDIAADVGIATATVKSFRAEIQDGAIDIRFTPLVDQPKVSAIEVIQKTADY